MIIYRYIARKHILPFVYAFSVILFVLMMQIAVQLLGKIIDKGLEPLVVLELFVIQMCWVLALAVPMAALVATLMAFGGMSADNEILAVKAAGISLYRLLVPALLSAGIVALLMVFFNNLVLPEANHRASSLTSDISRKKPAAFIEPRVLIRDFPGYVMYVDRVHPRSGLLRGVRVFTDMPGQNPAITVADSGRIGMTEDGAYLQLTLYHGESHSVDLTDPAQHYRARYGRQVLFLKNVDTELQRTDRAYRSDREKSAAQMRDEISQFRQTLAGSERELDGLLDTALKRVAMLAALADSFPASGDTAFDSVRSFAGWTAALGVDRRHAAVGVQAAAGRASRIAQQMDTMRRKIAQYSVEVHKKYSIPVTTLVFVLIGAPLGIMARRGGLGVGTSYSILFFVLFWVFLIGGESLADRLIVPPAAAMWSGNVLVGIAGVYLVVRMIREGTVIPFAPLADLWRGLTGLPSVRAVTRAVGWLRRSLRRIMNVPFWVVRHTCGLLPTYLIRMFLGYFVGVLVALLAVWVIVDWVSNLRRFEGAPVANIVRYYWYLLPWIALTVLPIIVLLASMGAVGSMAKHSELTAMKGAGISIRQLTMPLLLLGALMAVGSFYVGEKVLPDANFQRKQLYEDMLDRRTVRRTGSARQHRELRREFYYFADANTVYRFDEFATHPDRTRNVWQTVFAGPRVVRRTQAASLDYRDSAWYFTKGTVRTFHGDTSCIQSFESLPDSALSATPDEMVVRLKGKEEMSYWELAAFIDKVKRQGEKVSMYMADLHFKLALPTMNFIVLIIAVSITARAGRKGTAMLFGVGLLITFAYWILSQFALAFARTGALPPLAGAWLGDVAFLALGAVLYRRAQQ